MYDMREAAKCNAGPCKSGEGIIRANGAGPDCGHRQVSEDVRVLHSEGIREQRAGGAYVQQRECGSHTEVIQGLFSFQMGFEENGQAYVEGFRYSRDNCYPTLADTRTGKHTTADGIRNLYFCDGRMTLEAFWKQLNGIVWAVVERFSEQYVEYVNGEHESIKASHEESKKRISALMSDMTELYDKIMNSAKNYEAAFAFQNKGIELFNNIEVFYAGSPLINLNAGGNERGHNEAGAIADARAALYGNDLEGFMEATNRLFDADAVKLIGNCQNVSDIQDYLPWLSDDVLERMYCPPGEDRFLRLKTLLINAMIYDHGKISSAIWGDTGMYHDFGDNLKQYISRYESKTE